ncbi:MAG: ABC transporter substrate-binding protein [Anaerolineae bacterium]
MKRSKRLMRRALWLGVLVAALAMLAVACGGGATPTPPPAEEKPTATSPAIVAKEETPTPAPKVSKYNEAPMLAELVAAGELPPVDERVSDNPLVTTPYESVGKYGGTMYTYSWWPEVGNVQLYFAVDAPIKWKADLTGYEPALAESYEWSDDGKTFTLHLRQGVRWSDGEPYTSEDWRFYWEDIANDPDYKVITVKGWLRNADGSPIEMEFPDEYTVVWKASDRPLWIDPFYMAQGFWEFAKEVMKPAHYLKEFHPKYNSAATYEDLEQQDKWWQTPGYPCLFAWCLESLSADGKRYTFARNPYFWRVDTAGNQLPYIDYIDTEIVEDEQVRILNCSQGKYTAAFRFCGGPTNLPFLREQADSGGYRMLENWMNGAGAWPGYMVNQYYVEGGQNYPDDTPERAAEIRELLRDKRFRQAMSIGFSRQRIIDTAWAGIGEAKSTTISPQSWHFASPEGQDVFKRWAETYSEFDPDTANAMLDEIGLVDEDGDGFRDLKGKPFTLIIDISDWGGSLKTQEDACAEMDNQWETNVGVKVECNNLQGQPDLDTRTNEGFYMMRGAHIAEVDIWTYPDWIFPIVNRYYFPLEGRYYQMGKEECELVEGQPYSCGVKPEPGSPAAKLQALYEKGLRTGTVEDRHKVVWEAVEVIIEEGPFVIAVAGDQLEPIMISKNLRNVMDFGVVGPWAPSTPGNQVPAQWWLEQ